ncbi:MAG: alpha/beta hydrolase family protein [Dehalococcoidia bacterium]
MIGLLLSLASAVGRRTRAAWTTLVFLFEVFPMLPSRPFDLVTPRPVVERMRYRTSAGEVEADLYRPSSDRPHPSVVVCLGVVPFGVEHPQVPRLGRALARSGFVALMHWSPAMRDFRLEPIDADDIASAYAALTERHDVDPARSGLLGTCVGGAFALVAASRPAVRHRVSFVLAYAAYASMATLARDIASGSTDRGNGRETWEVDQLTRHVFVSTVTATLDPDEAARLRATFAQRGPQAAPEGATEDARAVLPLLCDLDASQAEAALRDLPEPLRARLGAMSPLAHLDGLRAPLVVLLHDRDDPVIPVGESRALHDALDGRDRYTEFTVFKHLDPTRGKPKPLALARELFRFARAVQPVFRRAAG